MSGDRRSLQQVGRHDRCKASWGGRRRGRLGEVDTPAWCATTPFVGPQFGVDSWNAAASARKHRLAKKTQYSLPSSGQLSYGELYAHVQERLSSLDPEDGTPLDRHLQAVVLSVNSTRHTATGFGRYFSGQGREAVVPNPGVLGRASSRSCFCWMACKMATCKNTCLRGSYKAGKGTTLVACLATLPKDPTVAVRLRFSDTAEYPAKLASSRAGPWTVPEGFSDDKTHTILDALSKEERQVTRAKLKLLDLPVEREMPGLFHEYTWAAALWTRAARLLEYLEFPFLLVRQQ